jgi:hypothetical protein
MLIVGIPSILGISLIVANQLNPLSLADDYRTVQPVVIDGSAYDSSLKDAFEFFRVDLDDDLLIIEVSFIGSQMNHDFVLIGAGDFMESSPIQTSVVLSHDSNGDLGTALMTKELIFDLKPLKKAFFSIYSFFSPNNISLQINLEGYGEIIYTL